MSKTCSILSVSPRVEAETEDTLRIGFYLADPTSEDSEETLVAYGVYDSYEENTNCDVHIYGISRDALLSKLGVTKSQLYRYLRGEANRLFQKHRVNHISSGEMGSE